MNDIPKSNNNYSIIKYIRLLYMTFFILKLIIFKLLSRDLININFLVTQY